MYGQWPNGHFGFEPGTVPPKSLMSVKSLGDPSAMVNDDLSKFRSHVKNARSGLRRNPDLPISITASYLKELWERQEGRCALTGWFLVSDPNGSNKIPLVPHKASLDRINPKLGYIPGNVRFVAYIANVAKNRFSDSELLHFCKAVVTRSMTHSKTVPDTSSILVRSTDRRDENDLVLPSPADYVPAVCGPEMVSTGLHGEWRDN